jgi:hypothetical protein
MRTKKIKSGKEEDWEWFESIEGVPYEITGKYLFFSRDRRLLRSIAIDEIENGGFHYAKIPVTGKAVGGDYVLCLYYKDASRRHDLARKYREKPKVRYRYWKSEEETLSKKYSDKFIDDLYKDRG